MAFHCSPPLPPVTCQLAQIMLANNPPLDSLSERIGCGSSKRWLKGTLLPARQVFLMEGWLVNLCLWAPTILRLGRPYFPETPASLLHHCLPRSLPCKRCNFSSGHKPCSPNLTFRCHLPCSRLLASVKVYTLSGTVLLRPIHLLLCQQEPVLTRTLPGPLTNKLVSNCHSLLENDRESLGYFHVAHAP